MDPKRINVRHMKAVESIDARLARIETALGLSGPVGQNPVPQQQPQPDPPAPEPPPAASARQKERSRG